MVINDIIVLSNINYTLYLVSLMSLLDITLTYYIMWLDKRYNPNDLRYVELNVIGKIILNITKGGPLGLLIIALFAQTIIWSFVIMLLKIGYIISAYKIVCMFVGAFTVILWIHIHSIKELIIRNKNH